MCYGERHKCKLALDDHQVEADFLPVLEPSSCTDEQ